MYSYRHIVTLVWLMRLAAYSDHIYLINLYDIDWSLFRSRAVCRQNAGFSADMLSQASAIVSATIEVYAAAMANLLPTPAKSHYTFNLRDLARVVLGCTLVRKESVDNKRVFTR